jgi:starch synthase (maltosyl-transferring)
MRITGMPKKNMADEGRRVIAEPATKAEKASELTVKVQSSVPAGVGQNVSAATTEPAPKAEKLAIPEVAGGAVDGRKRIIIEGISPEVDGGRFPIKRTVGETVVVEADVFTDGHDALYCVLQYRKGRTAWREAPMRSGQ